ncbi:hypothetical protein Dimus_016015 [Dionaea muscipula]
MQEYLSIAQKYGLHPVSLAIAFVLRHPLIASAVFGATKLWQLHEVVDGCKLTVSADILEELNEVHARYPSPCP